MHILFVAFFQFVCVPFARRSRQPIAVELQVYSWY